MSSTDKAGSSRTLFSDNIRTQSGWLEAVGAPLLAPPGGRENTRQKQLTRSSQQGPRPPTDVGGGAEMAVEDRREAGVATERRK